MVSVHTDRRIAARHAERAADFLWQHDVRAIAHPVETESAPAAILLNLARELNAGLLVMGPYGQPAVREFFLGSVTRTLLADSSVPLFLFH
jgi:nucleotide-binding universal stress UspA family protein